MYTRAAPDKPWQLRSSAFSRLGAEVIGGFLLDDLREIHPHAELVIRTHAGPLHTAPAEPTPAPDG